MPITSKELMRIVSQHNYLIVSQKGSHIKYRNGPTKTLIIPNHKELKSGTAHSIVSDFCKQNDLLFENIVKQYNLKF